MRIPLDKFTDWLKNKNLKERTIENYVYYFNKFVYDSFDQESVSKFLAMKENRNSVARSFLVNFRKFLLVNYSELGIPQEMKVSISEVELPQLTGRTKQRIINPIPHHQIQAIEAHLDSEQLKIMLLMSYYCALRLGELMKIEIISFNWEEWKQDPNKMGECRVLGKGDKEGIALVPSFLMKRIARHIRSENFNSISSKLFTKAENITKMKNTSSTWQKKLRKAGIASGVTKMDGNGNPVTGTIVHPHRLRHSYATYLMNEKNLNIREVQEILRHSSIQSTQIYTHLNKEYLKKKLSE